MPPYLYGILMFLCSTSALLAGIVAGARAYTAWADRVLGPASFPFFFFGIGLGPFFMVIYLFQRFVTVSCPPPGAAA
jgi:hypothetical protein